MNILAIDIGGTNIKIGIGNESGNLKDFTEIPTESYRGGKQILQRIINFIKEKNFTFDRIGISTAGQVDRKTGSIIYASDNLPAYTGMKVKEIFKRAFSVPVEVINDVNAAALGEIHYGAGKLADNLLCLTYGTGIGGAIMIKKEIYEGTKGIAGEVGHMLLYPGGKKCTCGKFGCYEQYASTSALVRKAQSLNSCYTNGKTLFQHLPKDQALQQIYHEWLQNVGYGLASLIHIFNPMKIILGGGIMEQEKVLQDLRSLIPKLVIESFQDVILQKATLGNKAGLLGAIALHQTKRRMQ